MPKGPILSRELLYTTLRDGSIVLLDWCLVNTSLGGMAEARQIGIGAGLTPTREVDVYDTSFSRLTPMNEDKLWSLLGTSGQQFPRTYQN